MNDAADQPATPPARRVVMPITPERAAVFLKALRETGSYNAAAAAASPHLAARGSRTCSVNSFRMYARRNPEFAEAVEAAMESVKGEMEALVLHRARTPDERPIYDKNGRLLGVQTDSRPANQMLALWLSSHDPSKWAPKLSTKSEVTVTNTDAGLTSGTAYVVKPADVLLLDEDERATLIDLLSKLEERRAAEAPVVIEQPTRDYVQGWGPNASPSRLPAPADTDDVIDADATPLGNGADHD